MMIPAYGFIKLSVIFFYRRIFVKGTRTWFDIATKVSVAIVIMWTVAFFLAEIFKCGPHVSDNWGPLIDVTQCADPDKLLNGLFVSDFLTDLLVLLLPIPIVSVTAF